MLLLLRFVSHDLIVSAIVCLTELWHYGILGSRSPVILLQLYCVSCILKVIGASRYLNGLRRTVRELLFDDILNNGTFAIPFFVGNVCAAWSTDYCEIKWLFALETIESVFSTSVEVDSGVPFEQFRMDISSIDERTRDVLVPSIFSIEGNAIVIP